MYRMSTFISVIMLLLASIGEVHSQSLDCFSGSITTKGEVVETAMLNTPALIVFWSTRCSPCLKELPVMNQFARLNPKMNFIWVSSENEDAVLRSTDSSTNMKFINDADSTIWKKFNPTGWGVGFAFSAAGDMLWHGYTSEITEEMLSAITEGRSIERKKYRFGIEYLMVNEVGFGDYVFSIIDHEDGEEWRLKNKPMSSLISVLVHAIYGQVEIIELGAERASTPIKLSVRFRFDKGERASSFLKFLKMLCGGYDIQLTVGESREDGLKTIVVIDYTKYSG
jgi:thiol-disulfide isomerase/thioredoxin